MAAPSEPLVDLGTDAGGDRIAVVRDGEVSYLPATRADLGVRHEGSAGACRYTRRSSDGALYVTGPMLGRTMFRSGDGGRSWTGTPYELGMERFALERMPKDTEMGWIGAFAILRDDTFQMSVIPSNHRKNDQAYLARSTDFGATWSVERMELPFSDRALAAGNGDLIELADGTLLLTLDTWFYGESEDEEDLPVEQRGGFGYVLRSTDGGRTWPEKHCLSIQGGEVHLLELPSGTLLAAIRKQRNARLPGDPADIEVTMRANGYEPEYTGHAAPTEAEGAAFFKHVAVAESPDGGRTWVNERRVSGYEQCSGDLTLLADGTTLVLTYDSRYHGRFARAGVRARVSYDVGATWEPVEYVLGEGENYPGGIAVDDGGLITICPHWNQGPIQAVHWQPLPQGD